MENLLLVGATSAIAHECARLWVKNNPDLKKVILIARNEEKLKIVDDDLYTRSGNKIETLTYTLDFTDPLSINNVMDKVLSKTSIDVALIAQGSLVNNSVSEDLKVMSYECNVTALSPCMFLEKILKHMELKGSGKIGIIGSVAGDRGRLTNYIYGACKGFIETYVEGLHHHLKNVNSKVTLTLIKPGPTKSPMTQNLENGKKCADTTLVASQIVKAVNKGKMVLYTPKIWRIIMMVVRNLPMFIFKHLKI